MMIADFTDPSAASDWRFFTDQVMGGVSTGQAIVANRALRLAGAVSTENNGGFIQARLGDVSLPTETEALVIRVRGDGQRYFIHLRTTRTQMPWHYYQAAFTATTEWQEIRLPLAGFEPSGRMLPASPDAQDVQSVALVAYGRDHEADVELQWIRAE
ncbi:CIA30 family protein [Cognatishimia sp. F0-27]|uniref:CIA30 family protein n=1 Tax=Cognatishimia sp. F0-27 TaxID=2816855 RepID=UPI001D0C0B4C|nr:CIA30 family protein [Cognatishimia sp. F0-27]